MRNTNINKGRREFLKSSTGVALFIGMSGLLPSIVSCRDSKKIEKTLEKHNITAWVRITEDGDITIYNPAAEMGQGSMTSLPLIFAEEMDAEWAKVKVEFSPQEVEIYGSEGWTPGSKLMFTVGSRITKSNFPLMRQSGAQARHILMYSAAKHWGVPLKELTTDKSVVTHPKTKRSISYGALIPFLKTPKRLPKYSLNQLKKPEDFRLIGKEIPRVEIPDKVDGSAKFAADLRMPDMLYGVLERGNLHGAKPSLVNEQEILSIDGVISLLPFNYAIGIIANSLEVALDAKSKLKIKWSESDATNFNSQEIYNSYENIAEDTSTGKIIREKGNVNIEQNSNFKTFVSDFKNDYVYHAQMEPLNIVVQVIPSQQRAEVWVGSQQGVDPKLGIPDLLGYPQENVNIHLQYLGGGFGRRSMNDFVHEGVLLAKEVGPKPLKLIWTREDDIGYGAFRPLSLQRLKAVTSTNGTILSLSHCIIGDGGNLVASGTRNDHYDIPNELVEWRETKHGIRLKHWRAVGHGPNKFAIECMLDEIAANQKIDPISLRKNLMQNSPRALATIKKVEEMSNWKETSSKDRAKGVGFVEHGSLGSGVCEISLNKATGEIKVHHFWVALDAGIIIQPDNVKAQIEGGIIMGMSSVLKEQITIVDGRVVQSNFHDYNLLRIQDIPETIEAFLISSNENPEGVGETATPMVACCIANAFLRLTGKHLRHLPFTPERVLDALNT